MRNVEELALAYIEHGDTNARDLLFIEYERIIKQIILKNNLFLQGGDAEDLVQCGLLGLLRALERYDKSAGSFGAFAGTLIERRLLDAVRKDSRKKNAILSKAGDLELAAAVETPLEPEEEYIISESRARLETKLKSVLPPQDYKIFALYRSGHTYKEIASMLSITAKKVDNSLSATRRRLAKIISELND